MKLIKSISFKILALVMGLQIMYVSFNQYNLMLSNTISNVYLYEKNGLVECLTDLCLNDLSTSKDSKQPIGSTGLEEEEYHFYKKLTPNATTVPLSSLYKNNFTHHESKISEPPSEVTTPPPEA